MNHASRRTALVLGGGAARGAYEAGVVAYLRDELPQELGRHIDLDILTGTSVGALNACYLAGAAADPARQADELVGKWTSLRIENVLSFGARDAVRLVRDLVRRTPERKGEEPTFGGIVDPAGLRDLVRSQVDWLDIGRNIRAGRLHALSVSCTNVATGRTTVFVQRREKGTPPWSRDFHYRAIASRIGPTHALASAAIPLLFPAVPVGNELYVDGGLRQSVPLSPALRLGAKRVIVVSLRHQPVTATILPHGERIEARPEHGPAIETESREALRKPKKGAASHEVYPTAAFLAGKTLDALLLDRIDEDLNRLRRFNSILEAGTRSYGPDFETVLNTAFQPMRHHPMSWIRNILVHPSQGLGAMAADYARSPEFRKRASGFVGSLVRRLAESEAEDRADLVSYLLFDGGFAARLAELGRSDARARRDEWIRFFSPEPESEAEAAQLERDEGRGEQG
ncbi:patatin-like phospholipase family protein [Vulgatibacter incomptus]|uniref:patatin-like phospholipase family protein n=1 Tax=Vulgatibacter incomptus TaxID=1391653 RepID=UPI001F0AD3F6|nr:patatin-like phospholipase family protein [Vulgatibacter incomptus]